MKKLFLVVIASFLAAGAAQAQGAATAVAWPAADMKWTPMVDGPPGAQAVTLWGDMTKGAYGAMLKFPAGFSTPLHTHTSEMKLVVVSGTWIHTPEGKPSIRLGPGSYLLQPGGNYRHTTACDKASECLIFSESGGKFDLLPVK